MRPLHLNAGNRMRAARFALLGNVLPISIAVASDSSPHRWPFFVGAAGGCIAPVVVTTTTRRRRTLLMLVAVAGIPALTLMQAYTGGVASGYTVLMTMAVIWFGVQASDRELALGLGVFAACCYFPMLAVGPPAYPVSWAHATILLLIGCSVAGSLRLLTREMQLVAHRLREEAAIDDLTGVLNRRGWRYNAPRELARAARTGRPVALVTIDLDGFKVLNDESGHERGDRVLRETAERMQSVFRAGDVIARLGGDEFVAMLTNSALIGALGALERLREVTPADASFSAGVAVWDRAEDLQELARRSDQALYAAKSKGPGSVERAPARLASVRRLAAPRDDEGHEGQEGLSERDAS